MSELTINKYYDHEKALEDLNTFNPDINVDLMRQPGLFAYYNAQLVKAEGQYDRLRHARDVMEAKLDRHHREELSKAGGKVTEGTVKSAIQADTRMRKMEDLVREAKEQVGYLKGTCDAFKQRRDSLMQLAFNLREEGKGQPRVMGKAGTASASARRQNVMQGLSELATEIEGEIGIDL